MKDNLVPAVCVIAVIGCMVYFSLLARDKSLPPDFMV